MSSLPTASVWRVFVPLGLCCTAATAVAQQPGRGTLSGSVVDESGQPVAGARAVIDSFDAANEEATVLAEARTDQDGRFRLGPLAATHRPGVDVRIEADGFATGYVPSGSYSIYPDANNKLGRIVLVSGCIARGLVLDADGSPSKNATVEYQVHRYIFGHTIEPITAMRKVPVDGEGRFHTEPLPPGAFNLVVIAPNRTRVRQLAQIGVAEQITLEPIRLEEDAPIRGRLFAEDGTPVSGATILADGRLAAHSDEQGRFSVGGFGAASPLRLMVRHDDYVFRDLMVERTDGKLRWADVLALRKRTTQEELEIQLENVAWIEGTAVDADTGDPVELDRVVLCFFQRKPGGEVVLKGCRVSQFEQPAPGRFRVSYIRPTEYHLTFSAAGYHDAEAFTPKVKELRPIKGIAVKLSRKTSGKNPGVARQVISGQVTRDGKPVPTGLVALWSLRRRMKAINAPILRGRTVTGPPIVVAAAPICDGRYTIEVPYQSQDWYVVADLPGQPLTQLGPIDVALNEKKTFDIECPAAARLSGKVAAAPSELRGRLWVVAFTKASVRVVTPVAADGTFAVELAPGEYGLKVGHDGYQDSEVPRGKAGFSDIPPEKLRAMADPWPRARLVKLGPGEHMAGIELELPE